MKTVLSIIFWIVTIFFALAAAAFMPSIASIFGFLAAAIALPLFSWKKQLDNFFTLPIRIIAIALFAFLMFYTAPDVGEKNLEDTRERVEEAMDKAEEEDEEKEKDEQKEDDKKSESSEKSDADKESGNADKKQDDSGSGTQTVVAHGVVQDSRGAAQDIQGAAQDNQGHTHSFAEATCLVPKTCTVCNATEGHPIPHDFSEGFCVYCSISEVDTVMVWIPMHGGEKYHKEEDCSNMKEPSYVSKSYAEESGFEPCKRCY